MTQATNQITLDECAHTIMFFISTSMQLPVMLFSAHGEGDKVVISNILFEMYVNLKCV